MNSNEKSLFAQILMGIGEVYDKDITDNLIMTYWEVLKGYDLKVIKQATQCHILNPHQGAYFPRPAHLIAMCDELQQSTAKVAWEKMQEAIHRVGIYGRMAFDDPIIHIIIADMGGWVAWCRQSRDALSRRWPQFQKSYQYYANLPGLPSYLPYISGHVSENEPVVLMGEHEKAADVMRSGSKEANTLTIIPKE